MNSETVQSTLFLQQNKSLWPDARSVQTILGWPLDLDGIGDYEITKLQNYKIKLLKLKTVKEIVCLLSKVIQSLQIPFHRSLKTFEQ
jgi:hypothetical protein